MNNKPGFKLVEYMPKQEEPRGYTKEEAEYVLTRVMEQDPYTEAELRNLLWNALVQIVEGFDKPTPRSAAEVFKDAYQQPKAFPPFAERIRRKPTGEEIKAREAERAELREAILRDMDAAENKINMEPGGVTFLNKEISVKATPGEDKPTIGNTPGERGPYGYDK